MLFLNVIFGAFCFFIKQQGLDFIYVSSVLPFFFFLQLHVDMSKLWEQKLVCGRRFVFKMVAEIKCCMYSKNKNCPAIKPKPSKLLHVLRGKLCPQNLI